MFVFCLQVYKCPPGEFERLHDKSAKKIVLATKPQPISVKVPAALVKHVRTGSDPGRRNTSDETRLKLAALVAKHAADEQLQIRINNIQNTSALAAMRFNTPPGEHDPGIVDGFLEDVF